MVGTSPTDSRLRIVRFLGEFHLSSSNEVE